MNCELKFQSVFCCFLRSVIFFFFFNVFQADSNLSAHYYSNPTFTMGYPLHLKIPLLLPFLLEDSQLLVFSCCVEIKNERRINAFRLYDGTCGYKSRRSTHS